MRRPLGDGVLQRLEDVVGGGAKDDDGVDEGQDGGEMAAREIARRVQRVRPKRTAVQQRAVGVRRRQRDIAD